MLVPTDPNTRKVHDWEPSVGGFECRRCHIKGVGRGGTVTGVSVPDDVVRDGLDANAFRTAMDDLCRVMVD